jgi:MFS transporter, Spinster family, sphingosine-1-phosphate transporter
MGPTSTPSGNNAPEPVLAPLPGARAALALLLAINLFNYIDRQVLSAVLPKLKAEFTPNDPAANTKMGALTTAFMVAYMALAPVFGWLGDRKSRWALAGVGVIAWSLASGASGLATGYLILFLTRCCVGVGEAAYGPVAPGIISDLYPVEHRGSVLAWFYAAIPVGSALGFVIGGQVAETAWGWRGAFLVVVLPGLLLGILCFRMQEPPRGQADSVIETRPSTWADYRVLWQTPSYVLCTLGMTAMTFVLGGVAAFVPTYVYEREARFVLDQPALQRFAEKYAGSSPSSSARAALPPGLLERLQPLVDEQVRTVGDFRQHLATRLSSNEMKLYTLDLEEAAQTEESPGLAQISTTFGAIVVISGLVATLLGGIAGDRLRPYFPGAYFLVAGGGMLVAFPLFLGLLFTPFPYAWGFVFAAVFFLFFNTGPSNTVLANVTPPAIRATGFAVNIFIIHALGDAISPPIIGGLADVLNLRTAFLFVSFLIPISGLLWLWGARHLAEDTARAPTRL